jgi:hypothetical protein
MSLISEQDNLNPPYQTLGKLITAEHLVQDFPLFAFEFDNASRL